MEPWIERIMRSDLAKYSPEIAEKLVEAAKKLKDDKENARDYIEKSQ